MLEEEGSSTFRSTLDRASAAGVRGSAADAAALLSINSAIFKDVRVTLQAKLGPTSLTIEELLGLKPGSVLSLDTKLGESIELHLNNSLIARGEIVAVDDNFGVRIVQVADIS